MTEMRDAAKLRRAQGLLSLCARAGRLVSGAQGVEIALKKKGGFLLLADDGCAANTREALLAMSRRAQVPLLFCPFDLGRAIGKDGRMVALIQDEGFARAIQGCLAADVSPRGQTDARD